jgi:antitoxin PrlF
MESAKITSKGQITIPKVVRDSLGVQTGDRIHFLVREDGVVEMFPRTRDLLSLAGLLRPKVLGVSLEDMDAGIADAVVAEFGRSNP